MPVFLPRRLLLMPVLLIVAAALGACRSLQPVAPEAQRQGDPLPRLLVFFVVDGLSQRQLLARRDQLAPDGLARFLVQGAWFADAYHGHAHPVGASGHATLFTGAYPSRHGLIANEWRDPASSEPVSCVGDASPQGQGMSGKLLAGVSPRHLKVPTVGDALRRVQPTAKVIGISAKACSAVLAAGHAGTAYMYTPQTGFFTSSTHYMGQAPGWVDAFNEGRPADRWFKKAWRPLLPPQAYARSQTDSRPGDNLPMTMGSAGDVRPNPAYYAQLLRSPFVDRLTLDFARAAIEGEALGHDDVPDLLVISLSGHDQVSHHHGAQSRHAHDHLLQLDGMVQEFLRYLDQTVGRDNYLAVLSADHGFMPAPEQAARQGLRSGRVDGAQMLGRINAAVEDELGRGKWVALSGSSLLVNRQLLEPLQVDPADVAEAVRELLLQEPGIAAAYTREELDSGSRPEAPFFGAMQRAWSPEVSGDVQFILKPYWMFAAPGMVATHGSPYPYDTHVPLLVWGPRWVEPGRVDERIDTVDIAPTVAQWLGLPPLAQAQGRPLPLSRPSALSP